MSADMLFLSVDVSEFDYTGDTMSGRPVKRKGAKNRV
jgi:hypothetical protein